MKKMRVVLVDDEIMIREGFKKLFNWEEHDCQVVGERLQTLLSLDNIDDFVINTPTELWTYTLNESGEELLKKSFIETALSEEEEESYYDNGDDSDSTDKDEEEEQTDEKPAKKGFFAKLFGKKD